jgi:hypothetical protein
VSVLLSRLQHSNPDSFTGLPQNHCIPMYGIKKFHECSPKYSKPRYIRWLIANRTTAHVDESDWLDMICENICNAAWPVESLPNLYAGTSCPAPNILTWGARSIMSWVGRSLNVHGGINLRMRRFRRSCIYRWLGLLRCSWWRTARGIQPWIATRLRRSRVEKQMAEKRMMVSTRYYQWRGECTIASTP